MSVLLGIKGSEDAFEVKTGGCPFVGIFDGKLIYSKEASDFINSESGKKSIEFLRRRWSGSCGYIYDSLLAVPCLLKAFEAMTNDYGRMRFAQGPLWYFGSCLGMFGRFFELPLRWGAEHLEKRSGELDEIIRAELEEPLIKTERCAAWVSCLDMLSLVNFKHSKRVMAWNLGSGRSDFSEKPHPIINPFIPIWMPWTLMLLMCVWVCFGNGLWGAPALFLGLGYLVRIFSDYNRGSSYHNLPLNKIDWEYRFEPAVYEGRIARDNTPGLDDTWIEFEDSEHKQCFIRLADRLGWQFKENEAVQASGWIYSDNLSLYCESLKSSRDGLVRFPRLWRILVPQFLAGAGFVWCVLQLVRL